MVNWIFLQVLVVLFALFMVYYAYLSYRKKQILKQDWLFWSVLWGLSIFLVSFPQSLGALLETLNITRGLDLVFMVGFLLAFLLLFVLFKNFRENQKRLETIVERIALKEEKK